MSNCKKCIHGKSYNYIDICSYEKKLNKIEEAFETEDFPFKVTCTAFKDKDDIIDENPK